MIMQEIPIKKPTFMSRLHMGTQDWDYSFPSTFAYHNNDDTLANKYQVHTIMKTHV